MVLVAIAAVILLSACPSVAKTRSLVGTWNLSVIKSESETFTAFMQITTHEKGNLSGYLGNRQYSGNYGTISGTILRTRSAFSIQAPREERRFNSQENSIQMG